MVSGRSHRCATTVGLAIVYSLLSPLVYILKTNYNMVKGQTRQNSSETPILPFVYLVMEQYGRMPMGNILYQGISSISTYYIPL